MVRVFLRSGDLKFFISWELLQVKGFNIEMPLLLDMYSSFFLFTVRTIAFFVLCFSQSYIMEEKNYSRFHQLVLIFVFSMYLLILRPSLIRLFLGWDGLGVSSYFLVIYFENSKSYNAGILTALSNRVGDVLFLIRLSFFAEFTSWNYFLWRSSSREWNESFLAILIILACCTKSAQIPFSAWLPAAIAAPTPVSALVHSSTLVTAGVYTLFRFIPFLCARKILTILFILGTITIAIAGISALQETDAKKIVALSTLRQLGLMIMRLGALSFKARYFHLVSHAFFKALLFIVVGNLIHLSLGYQDLRSISSAPLISPGGLVIGNICNFRLIGLPFISGFYSKDFCIESRFMLLRNITGEILFLLGILLTIAYSLRLRDVIFSLRNLNPGTWIQEKRHLIFKPIIIFFPISVLGRRIIIWISHFSPANLFIDHSLKFIILRIISITFFLKKTIFTNIDRFWFIERIFYMWNLPWIRASRHVSLTLSTAKTIFKLGESFLIPSSSWNFFDANLNSPITSFRFTILRRETLAFIAVLALMGVTI